MKYLYYHLWIALKAIPTNTTPATNALVFLCMAQCVNIFSIFLVINNYHNEFIYMIKAGLVTYLVTLYFCVLAIDYSLLYKKRNEMEEKYKNESKSKKTIGVILGQVYVYGSIILVFLLIKQFPLK